MTRQENYNNLNAIIYHFANYDLHLIYLYCIVIGLQHHSVIFIILICKTMPIDVITGCNIKCIACLLLLVWLMTININMLLVVITI